MCASLPHQLTSFDNHILISVQILFKVRDVLTRGHIFVNTSLTEAYCMAIVEAASCGLQVVSTRVGGIPEVLPSSLIILTDPSVESVLNGVQQAIKKVIVNRNLDRWKGKNGGPPLNGVKRMLGAVGDHTESSEHLVKRKRKRTKQSIDVSSDDDIERPSDRIICPFECNEIVGRLYNWDNVSVRTELVYQRVMTEADPAFGDKLNCYLTACVPFLLVVSFSYLLLRLLDYIQPRRFIDVTPDFESFVQNEESIDGGVAAQTKDEN